MPQKTNLNISPYYDDFDKADNYYKVLFKPGYPVQARELSGLQSILQNQVEQFGNHIFKEGSMVIPGSVTYDSTYFSCKVNPDHLGIDVSIYLDALIANGGTRVKGQTSQIVAKVVNYILPPKEGVEEITIFVKYTESDSAGVSNFFPSNEILILDDNITYGNTTLNSGDTILTLVADNPTATGSAVGVDKGVYFLRGTFVDVPKSTVILEPYSNKPSYRVGFEIIEEIITSSDDSTLNDNAKGFTNYAAPGADRFKISTKLTKKSLDDFDDINFVELVRVRKGEVKKIQNQTQYSEIRKYLAKRTYDESGNYAINPFNVNIQNSLNDEIGSNGLYLSNEKTDQGGTPTDDLVCVKLSSGKAYVRGFDVPLPGTTVLDVDKPRDAKNIKAETIPFRMGSLLRVNNVHGTPYISLGPKPGSVGVGNTVTLYSRRKGSDGSVEPRIAVGSGGNDAAVVGQARVYSFAPTDDTYKGVTTQWDLFLYDLQTYTVLEIAPNQGGLLYQSGTLAPSGSRVRGMSSGAIGYVEDHPNTNEINVIQTTGTFVDGETIIFNEQTSTVGVNTATASVTKVTTYTVDDIKSVHQPKDIGSLEESFTADAVLYPRTLANFSLTDQLNVDAASATCPNRRFSGKVGIKTDSIIQYYKSDVTLPIWNRVSAISANGETLTLVDNQDIAGLCDGTALTSGNTTESSFNIMSPRVINFNRSGLYSKLPKKNISTLDLADSTLTIGRQVKGVTVNAANAIVISAQTALESSGEGGGLGITTAFFEPFDAERYSIHYDDGSVETLNSDQVSITNGGANIAFTALSKTQNTKADVNVTLKKLGLASKTKNYIRSNQVEVSNTISVSSPVSGLTQSNAYGLRVEDKEISLNVPDAVKVLAVYESTNQSTPTLDGLEFVSGLELDTKSFVGEQIVGETSRAIGQIVNRKSDTIVEYVYLNGNKFIKGETISFKESNISSVAQKIIPGSFVDRTGNYTLDKGHRKQFSDYSRIVRKGNSSQPSNKLLIIFDSYEVADNSSGDFFTVNSYNKDRYTYDIPSVGGNRATDILDFRPRVQKWDPSIFPAGDAKSPFSFSHRIFDVTTRYIISPDESTVAGYSYYLPRIDKLVINKNEQVKLIRGVSDDKPAPPTEVGDSMEIAEITYPPYLYDPIKGPNIRLYDNRRFTMRDIGKLEKRITNLEVMTSLTALELDTKSLQVKDADGIDRFKSGFVANDFKNRDFINFNSEDGSRCDVDVVNKELISAVDFWSMKAELGLNPGINVDTADMSSNLSLLDPNCQKTGDLITLKYDEVDWINQPQASGVENINPFNVIVYVGGIILDPPSDNWTRTIYIDNKRTESTGNTWNQVANIVSDNTTSATDVTVTSEEIEADQDEFDGNHVDTTTTTTTTTTQTVETSFTNQMTGDNQEFDYVESVKISGESDTFMRSRNVYFAANGLKPFTKHIHKLDSGTPDVFPKIIEISTIAGTQGFKVGENVKVMNGSDQIGYVKAQAPNHKFGDTNRPEVGAGLGSPSVTVEKYTVDPFDKSRPGPAATYSSTSLLFNCDVSALANGSNYYGYVVNGAKLVGEETGTEATVTNVDLMSDNWGDVLGAFFFRNPHVTPPPSVLFYTGTKTFRLTANTTGEFVPPGSTALASDASGTFSGTGTILTQTTSTVGVRNPPPPAQKPNEITTTVNVNSDSSTTRVEAPYRDPLAQTFTVDETGAFLTSFDVFFFKKDPNAKVFVELREVELGTPTSFLVQDFAQTSLNPNNINTSVDATVATTVKFPSPVFLESGKEYALVFLSPGSDEYEMWVATMGQKSVTPPTGLPATTSDSQFGVVTKQYIGGSLFKSQNGTIWTPSQYQDLKFTLRKASFVPHGTTTFYNTPIEPGNSNTSNLHTNPIRTLPRKIKFGVTNVTETESALIPIGRKISTGLITDEEDNSITGIIEDRGAPIMATPAGIKLITASKENGNSTGTGTGSGYFRTGGTGNINGARFISLTGSGTGLIAQVAVNNDSGKVTSFGSVTTSGSGYVVGEILTLDNANSPLLEKGSGAKFVVTDIKDDIDTLFLTDVQGEKFVTNDTIIHYGAANDTRTLLGNSAKVTSDSVVNGDINSGNVIEVIQYNHAHHGSNNKVRISNVAPDTEKTTITEDLSSTGTQVSVAATTIFDNFAGITTDRGEALINGEIVSYIIGVGILNLSARGAEGSTALSHSDGDSIQAYEVSGMPLVKINTTHDIPSNQTLRNGSNIDNYFLELSRGTGNRLAGKNQLNFATEKAVGGGQVGISQNHQFSNASAKFNVITPGTTRVSSSYRTVTGTSANGNEVSFIDQGFEPTILNETTFFPTPRLVASKVNEAERLDTLPKSKSLSLKVDMNSTDANLSPVLDVQNATFVLGRNKINNPIGEDNYATDSRTNEISGDPHGSIFVSNRVNLKQPATSIKVFVAANVRPEADFRVFYRLFTADSSEVSSTYRAFPGFNNLIDTNGDGFGDVVIDPSNNDGRSDALVKKNGQNDFSEYQFTVNDLEQFSGFTIKIVMTSNNECTPIRLKDFRAIALA